MGFYQKSVPHDSVIATALNNVGWQDVEVNESAVSFLKPNMEIDFGGIVKEYAADSAAMMCKNSGILYGIINLGGDIKAIGPILLVCRGRSIFETLIRSMIRWAL